MDIQKELFALADPKYAALQIRLTPVLKPETCMGVRVPEARKLAKKLMKEGGYEDFLKELPHQYYDENMLHGLLLSEIKDYGRCMDLVEAFLPHVDNWAVCDTMAPRCFAKHKPELLEKIRFWAGSSETYIVRFGLEMLMRHFLDEDFQPEYLEIPAVVRSEEYYVNMMIAWFFATALAKQWDAAVPYLQSRRLAPWTHNKTIQKARESYRITPEQKEYLASLKIKKEQ